MRWGRTKAKKGPEKRTGPQQDKLEGTERRDQIKENNYCLAHFPTKPEIEFSSVLLSAGVLC